MKTNILIFFYLIFLSINCNYAKANSINLARNPTIGNEVIESDPDWILIASTNEWMMEKIINAGVDPMTVNFSNKQAFLSIVNLTEEEYTAKHNEVRAAALRLIDRYQWTSTANCTTCNLTEEELISLVKKNVDYYRNNPTVVYKITSRSVGSGGGSSQPCYNASFYMCVVLCAATIEAFPVYLFCCYMCGCWHCCNQMCPTND